MKYLIALFSALFLAACREDETVAAYGGAGQQWHLIEIDGKPFNARATVTFPQPGKIAGQAPCNAYSGTMTAPYPWFETGPLAATRMACDALGSETRFFQALGDMTQSEVSGKAMILSNETGHEMVFEARD
ncbi:MAG: META domain-containing protein [Rhodobacteraceae bacterium]|nr:META domain-containing protein [Paracoccaceae bacterium]